MGEKKNYLNNEHKKVLKEKKEQRKEKVKGRIRLFLEKIENNLTSKEAVFGITLLYLFLLVPIMFYRFPDVRNELKYFEITDSMLKNGNIWIMKYFGELYPDKPPLFFWLLMFLRSYFKDIFYLLALLIGSVLPSYIITLLSFKIFKKMIGVREAFLAAMILATLPFFIGAAAVIRMDMLMTSFIMGSLYIFYNHYFGYEKYSNKKNILMYILMGIGILVKGGAAFAVPVVAMSTLILLDKRKSFFKEVKLLRGVGIVLLIVAAWMGILYFQPEGVKYIKLLLGQETLGRALKSKAHVRPIYYYLQELPVLFAPYTLFLIFGLFSYLKRIKEFKNFSNFEKLGFTLFLGPFIFFSLLSGKLQVYLLPLFPGVAAFIYAYIRRIKDTKISVTFNYIVGGLLFLLGISSNFFTHLAKGVIESTPGLIVATALVIGGLGIIYFNKERRYFYSVLSYPVAMILLFSSIIPVLPNYNKLETLKPVIEVLSEEHRDMKLVAYSYNDIINISSTIGREFLIANSPEELKAISEGSPVIVGTKVKVWKNVENTIPHEVIYKNNQFIILKVTM